MPHAAAEVARVHARRPRAPSAGSGGGGASSRRPGRAGAAPARSSARRRRARSGRRCRCRAARSGRREFRITCSETMITSTAPAKPSPCASVNSGSVGRAATPRAGADSPPHLPPAPTAGRIRLSSGAAAIASAATLRSPDDARSPAARRPPPARPTPSAPARRRGRTGAARRGSRARSSSPRRGRPPRRRPSRRCRAPEKSSSSIGSRSSSATTANSSARPSWIVAATRSAGPIERLAGLALGDRARQQLLDGPVDDRGGQEDRGPQRRDRPVAGRRRARARRASGTRR